MSELKVLGIYAAGSDEASKQVAIVITTVEMGRQVFSLTREQAIETIAELSDRLKEMGPEHTLDRDADEDRSDDDD